MRRIATLLLVAGASSSCFAVTNLDRFHAGGGSAPYQDLTFTFRGAVTHVSQLFEYRVIDANNLIQSRGVYQPMGAPDTTVHVRRAVPRVNGPYRLDFYADKNHSGGYDGLNTGELHDHAWRIEPLVSSAPGSDPNADKIDILYDHNTSFTEINEHPPGTPNPPREAGAGATLHLVNLGDYQGKLLEVRIADASLGHVSGLFRAPALALTAIDVTIAGVIDPEAEYDVSVYIDANGNGAYDNPAAGAGDQGFVVHAASTAQGLTVTLDPKAAPDRAVDVGPP